MTPRDRLRDALRHEDPQLDPPKPGSTWELMAAKRLSDLEEDVKNMRSRLDNLIWSIAGAIALMAINYLGKLL